MITPQTYSQPILLSLDDNGKITNFCLLSESALISTNISNLISNTFNFNDELKHVLENTKNIINNKNSSKNAEETPTEEQIDQVVCDTFLSVILASIQKSNKPFSLIEANVEITGTPQIGGMYNENEKKFAPSNNPELVNSWNIDPILVDRIVKSQPHDETYIFDFDNNEWFPNPELEYDLSGDGKLYKFIKDNNSWQLVFDPEVQ